jgi:hypothetical protein
MRRRWTCITALAVLSAAVLGCGGTTEPRHSDVDLARRTWLTSHPSSYGFEIAMSTSWFPQGTGYWQVYVSDGRVGAVTDAAGQPVANYTTTLDTLWNRILGARAAGQLNSALFDQRGVPVESDIGEWASDGGVHYSVRNFAEGR